MPWTPLLRFSSGLGHGTFFRPLSLHFLYFFFSSSFYPLPHYNLLSKGRRLAGIHFIYKKGGGGLATAFTSCADFLVRLGQGVIC